MSPAPVKPADREGRSPLRLRERPAPAPGAAPDAASARPAPVAKPAIRKAKKPSAQALRLIRFRRLMAWLLFFGLAVAMYGMRYLGWLGVQAEMMHAAIYVVIGLHLIVVAMAAREDLFYAFLALIVPGYSLYYLFARSGRAWLCAITAGLLVGFGEDAWGDLSQLSFEWYEIISKWIRAGA